MAFQKVKVRKDDTHGATDEAPTKVQLVGATVTGGTFTNESEGTKGAPAPAKADQSGGVDDNGDLQAFRVDGAGRQKVSDDQVQTLLAAISALLTTIRDQQQNDGLTDGELRAAAVDVDTGLAQPTTPADTQPVSAVALPLPAGAATQATLASMSGKLPILSGTWKYYAGAAGASVSVTGRVLSFSASAPALTAATIVINGGQTITIPAGRSFDDPSVLANLVDPTIVFTGVDAYYISAVA